MIDLGDAAVADRRAMKHQKRRVPSIRRGVVTVGASFLSAVTLLAFLAGLAAISGALVGFAWRGFVFTAGL